MPELRIDSGYQVNADGLAIDWHYQGLFDWLRSRPAYVPLLDEVEKAITVQLERGTHGDLPRWTRALSELAHGGDTEQSLRELMPWRKGPIECPGFTIDTEWRSDWKWQRVAPHIDVANKSILDVGSGNGYYGRRMLEAGAENVLGVDPTILFVMQHLALDRVLGRGRNWVVPMTLEQLPDAPDAFDVVFSMGVLYHRKSPPDHLLRLRHYLKPGGQLVLETLVVEGDENTVLVPPGRYARMRNVWFLPSSMACVRWLQRCGFRDIEVVDESITTLEEQRTTDWMPFESLRQSLDPKDKSKTIEGLPAPRRAVIIGRR